LSAEVTERTVRLPEGDVPAPISTPQTPPARQCRAHACGNGWRPTFPTSISWWCIHFREDLVLVAAIAPHPALYAGQWISAGFMNSWPTIIHEYADRATYEDDPIWKAERATESNWTQSRPSSVEITLGHIPGGRETKSVS
jgi:hypothetical protein